MTDEVKLPPPEETKNLKTLLFLSGLFWALLIFSNFAAVKLVDIWIFSLPASVVIFPFCFVLGDLINELFGFTTARRVILYSFIFNAVIVVFAVLTSFLPSSPFSGVDDAGYNAVFLTAPRVMAAGFAAFLVSGLLNAYVFKKFKEKKSALALRSAVSSFLGIIADSIIFITAAFSGVLPFENLLLTIAGQILAKLLLGVGLGTPLTVFIIRKLKRDGK